MGCAEAIFADLTPEIREVLPDVIKQFVTIDLESDRAIPKIYQPIKNFITTPERKMLVNTLVDAHLLIRTKILKSELLSLEAVCLHGILMDWWRVKEWVEENYNLLRLRAEIEEKALLWEETWMKNLHGGITEHTDQELAMLLSGQLLEEAKKLLGCWPDALNKETINYIRVSSAKMTQGEKAKSE